MKKTESGLRAWVSYCRPKPNARLRLYCLPYAGGSASIFRAWQESLPADLDVCPIQYPGRENRFREHPHKDVLALVEALGQALAPSLDLPYALFGHSMGGLVGFELARWLAGHHTGPGRLNGPAHLFVSGTRAPNRSDPHLPIHNLPDDQFVQALRGLNGTPEAVLQNPEQMELFSPTLRADFEAVETYSYVPGAPLACPISAFGGSHDPKVSQEDLVAWEQQTSERFRWRIIPGDHFFVNTARQSVLGAIAQDLSAA